jgi:hypothetical protein
MVGLHDIYKRLSFPEDAMRLFEARDEKYGKSRLGLRFKVPGTVASGDGDTSAGNSFIHIQLKTAIAAHLMLRAKGLDTIDSMGQLHNLVQRAPYRAMVCGDDGVTVMSRELYESVGGAEGLTRLYLQYGFEAKVKLTTRYTSEFCSSLFWPTHSGLVMGPKPGRVLAKSFWTRLPKLTKPGKLLGWVRAVAKSLSASSSHVPVLRVVVECLLEITDGVDEYRTRSMISKAIHMPKPLGGDYSCCPETWSMMYERYGLTRCQVDELENFIRKSLTTLPVVLSHPYLDQIVSYDTGLVLPE